MATHAGSEHLDENRRYDDLPAGEQAAMRVRWADRIAERRERLDLGAEFDAEGRPYATVTTDGSVVIHNAEALEHRTGLTGRLSGPVCSPRPRGSRPGGAW